MILVPTLLAVKFYRQAQTSIPPGGEIEGYETGYDSSDALFEPNRTPSALDELDALSGSYWVDTRTMDPVSADPPYYQLLYEDFYAPQPYNATERAENTIYLTFDDGPSDRTDEILEVLAEKNVKATFFVIGQSSEKNLERMRRIVEEGHTIGMHSFSHDYAAVYTSVESFLDEFYRNFIQIQETTHTTPTVFRFPGGSINGYDGAFYQEILSEMIRRGFVPFDWNISSEDAASTQTASAEQLADNVVRYAGGKVRGFVLFHDSEQKITTPKALSLTIDRLREMGFTFEAITPDTLPVLYNYTE